MIIVIAIMAILIGVIALAVIPNIQRSRESKDLSTLDGITSAVNVAIANAKIGTSISKQTLYTISSGTATLTTSDLTIGGDDASKTLSKAFMKAFKESFGDSTVSLGSSAIGDATAIFVDVNYDGSAPVITVYAGQASSNYVPCKYTSEPDGFFVCNGGTIPSGITKYTAAE